MSFWDNVVNELNYIGMTNKALAEKAGFDPSNIGRGLRYKSSPSAETAVKIAKILNVTVEYLVNGNDSYMSESKIKFKKYSRTLEKLDSLPEKSRNSIIKLIDDISEDLK